MHTGGINKGSHSTPHRTEHIKPSSNPEESLPIIPRDSLSIGEIESPSPKVIIRTYFDSKNYNEVRTVIKELGDCHQRLTNTEEVMYRADNDIQDASRNLDNAGFPIRQAAMDTTETDVSHHGYHIGTLIGSARRDIDRGYGKSDIAYHDVDHLKGKLASSYSRIKKVASEMTEPHQKTVRNLLSESLKKIGTTFELCSMGQIEINGINREIQRVIGNIHHSDPLIWDVKSDRPGKDVSVAGRNLENIVGRSRWGLRGAERYIRGAEIDLNKAGDSLAGAIETLQNASELMSDKADLNN